MDREDPEVYVYFMFLIVAGIVVIALLSGTYAWDRRARRQGHELRKPGQMAQALREAEQDAPATVSDSWIALNRRNRQR